MLQSWFILIVGGLCEAGWAFCLNQTKEGSGWWYAGFAALYILSAVCLAVASKRIPVGTAYAVWTGIGALGTMTMGLILFKEPLTTVRLICMTMIFTAVIGLEVTQKM